MTMLDTATSQENLQAGTHDTNPVTALELALDQANPAIATAAKFVAGDFIDLAKSTIDLSSHLPGVGIAVGASICAGFQAMGSLLMGDTKGAQQAMQSLSPHAKEIAIAGAFLGAAGMVALNFVPLGKVATKATQMMGRSLGSVLCKKVITERFEKELAKVAVSAAEKAIKSGEHSLEKLLVIQKDAIAHQVKQKVSSIVENDVYDILVTVNSRFSTKESVGLALRRAGLEKEEAKALAAVIVKSDIRGKLNSQVALSEMEKVLSDSMVESFMETFEKGLREGKLGQHFKIEYAVLIEKSKTIPTTLKQGLIDGADEIFEKGVKEGAEAGIRDGVKKAFKKFRKDKYRLDLQESFKKIDSQDFIGDSSHGGMGIDHDFTRLNHQYENLANTWREETVEATESKGLLASLGKLRDKIRRDRSSATDDKNKVA